MLMHESEDDRESRTEAAGNFWDVFAQLLRFGLVGIMATFGYALGAGGAYTLGSSPYYANLVGYCFGTIISFVGHFYWTFGKRTDHGRHFARFLVLALAGVLASSALVLVIVDFFHLPFWVAAVTIALVIPLATWMSSRYWAFR